MAVTKTEHGEPSVAVADALGAVGEVAYQVGSHERAAGFFREALSMYAALLPEDSEHPARHTVGGSSGPRRVQAADIELAQV